MARALLALLITLALGAGGSTVAVADPADDLCLSDSVAGVAQADGLDDEELLPDDEEEWLEGDDELLDGEEDWDVGDDLEGEDEDFCDLDELDFEDDGEDDFDEEDEEESGDDSSDGRDSGAAVRRSGVRRGTRGADRFVGGAGIDRFFGGAGNDFLDGAGGADQLNGGPGDDVLVTGTEPKQARAAGAERDASVARRTRGTARKVGKRARGRGDFANAGPGNDSVRARNGRVDRILCGRGRDAVLAEPGDRVSNNCETVKYG